MSGQRRKTHHDLLGGRWGRGTRGWWTLGWVVVVEVTLVCEMEMRSDFEAVMAVVDRADMLCLCRMLGT